MQNFKLKGFKGYRDHYNFTAADLTSLINEADGAQLVCTEKDYIKLKSLNGSETIKYVSIENQIEGDENFINWIKNKVEIES
jgi:tetraacyldisaccharide-1-P 4'-kinase